MKVFATYNVKGGVGKTSTAVNLAYLAGRAGYRTLLWDLDPQGAASFLFRVRPRVKGGGRALLWGTRSVKDAVKGTDFDNLDLLPADFTYRTMDLTLDASKKPTRRFARVLAPLDSDYDVIFLDCPPSMSLVSENVAHVTDTLLVPIIPTTLSLRSFDQLTDFVGGLSAPRPALLGFFSMVDSRRKLHRDIVDQLPTQRTDIARAAIPALSVVEQMAVRREPVPVFAPRSVASRRYEQLWAEAIASTD
jgi:chromosome partitioning protein